MSGLILFLASFDHLAAEIGSCLTLANEWIGHAESKLVVYHGPAPVVAQQVSRGASGGKMGVATLAKPSPGLRLCPQVDLVE